MENTLNSGSLQTLNAGETLLVQARKVANGKIQLELAEILTSSPTFNPLSVFNKSDKRFSGGARRAWLTCEISDATELLGLDCSDNADWVIDDMGRNILPLNVINPVAQIGDNVHTLKVEVVETTEPSEWQAANLETSAKRAGADGDFIKHNGNYIFSNTRVTFDVANHVYLKADTASVKTDSVNQNTGEIFN